MKYSGYLNDEPMPDATSEKEQVGIPRPILLQLPSLLHKQALVKLDLLFPVFWFQGNEYFKQKKFADAIECYSRSIGLSPAAITFANRAMAYLKLRRQVTLRLYAFSSPYVVSSFVLLLVEVPHLH